MSLQTDVFEQVRTAAYAYGVPRLAAKMGIQPGTLYNKLNNDDSCSHHKITLQDFIQIINITDDFAPLLALAALFDHATYRLPDMSALGDDALLDLVNQVHINGGHSHNVLACALADGRITAEEYQRYAHESQHWLAAILALKNRVKTMVVVIDEKAKH